MNLPADPRMRLRAILVIIFLTTIPCYCVGLVAIMVAPSGGKTEQTQTPTLSLTSTINFSVTPVLNTLTPSLAASATETPTQTVTPASTHTPTLFIPPTWTPSISPTLTATWTLTLVPPTATFTSSPTWTNTPLPPTPTFTETPTPP